VVLYDGTEPPEGSGWSITGDLTGGQQSLERAIDEFGNAALRVQGSGFSDWGSSVTLRLPPGADVAGSVGISFRIRGTHDVRFSAAMSDVIPVAEGGSCTDACWNAHGTRVPVTGQWKPVTVGWADLAQLPGWGTEIDFDPARVVSVSWTLNTADAYDLWLDDVALVFDVQELPTGSGGAGPGTGVGGTSAAGGTDGASGGSGGSGGGTFNPSNAVGQYVSDQMFRDAFPQRSARYKYQALLAAVDKFPEFAACCNETAKKREVAAFLANVEHETGALRYVEENEATRHHGYCSTNVFPCPAGNTYWGRGAIQISWNYNYKFAWDYLSANTGLTTNIFENPAAVATDDELVWTTALWFWMVGDPSYTQTPHTQLAAQGFGATIRIINGALECDGNNPGQVQSRVDKYLAWCERLGVEPGSNLYC
jgi:predicted chitinase